MIATNLIIYSFIISTITTFLLKIYEKMNEKEYETAEYIKIFLITLLSSIATFYLKTIIDPIIGKFVSGGASSPVKLPSASNPTNLLGGMANKPMIPQQQFPSFGNMAFNNGIPTF